MRILQGRILEWVAISSSRGWSQTRDQTQVSCKQADSLPAELPGKPCYVWILGIWNNSNKMRKLQFWQRWWTSHLPIPGTAHLLPAPRALQEAGHRCGTYKKQTWTWLWTNDLQTITTWSLPLICMKRITRTFSSEAKSHSYFVSFMLVVGHHVVAPALLCLTLCNHGL